MWNVNLSDEGIQEKTFNTSSDTLLNQYNSLLELIRGSRGSNG